MHSHGFTIWESWLLPAQDDGIQYAIAHPPVRGCHPYGDILVGPPAAEFTGGAAHAVVSRDGVLIGRVGQQVLVCGSIEINHVNKL